jgi:hypothetical protein
MLYSGIYMRKAREKLSEIFWKREENKEKGKRITDK